MEIAMFLLYFLLFCICPALLWSYILWMMQPSKQQWRQLPRHRAAAMGEPKPFLELFAVTFGIIAATLCFLAFLTGGAAMVLLG